MKGLNKVQIMGNANLISELKYGHKDQVELCSVRIKCSYATASKTIVEMINCIAFGSMARLCHDNLKEGDRILIEGHIQTRAKNKLGVEYNQTSVVIDNLYFLERRDMKSVKETRTGDVVRRVPEKIIDDDDTDVASRLYAENRKIIKKGHVLNVIKEKDDERTTQQKAIEAIGDLVKVIQGNKV